ncbi:MAG: hypothetical protein JKY46_08360 [Robiginitomaculum sp.]|nr:hypothetical protein [Robiginitomaculum sp.]
MEYIPYIVSLVSVIIAGGAVYISYHTTSKQIRMQAKMKIADLRQEWIHQLREAMAQFQSFAVTPDLSHQYQQEFYRYGTKIELLMNNADRDYKNLQDCMYNLLEAISIEEKYKANPKYIEVCQEIIKREWETLKKNLRNLIVKAL